MSNNGEQQQPQPVQVPQPQIAVIECQNPTCKAPVRVPIPMLRIINDRNMSLAFVSHEVASVCEKCGTGHVPLLQGFDNVQWRFVPVKPQSQIVKPPAGLQIPRM